MCIEITFLLYFYLGPTLKKAAKGKLLDCFNNRRREYKKAGIITSRCSHGSQLIRSPPGFNVNSTGVYVAF